MGGNYGTLGQQLDQGLYVGKQEFGAIHGLGSGIISTALFKPDFTGFENSVHNLYTGVLGTNTEENDITNPPSAAEINRRQSQKSANQNTATLAGRSKTSMGLGRIANSAYSGNMSSITPPSQLAKISDPTARMAIAGSRGVDRGFVQNVGAGLDIQAHSALASATGASNDVGGSNLMTVGTPAEVANGSNPPVVNP